MFQASGYTYLEFCYVFFQFSLYVSIPLSIILNSISSSLTYEYTRTNQDIQKQTAAPNNKNQSIKPSKRIADVNPSRCTDLKRRSEIQSTHPSTITLTTDASCQRMYINCNLQALHYPLEMDRLTA